MLFEVNCVKKKGYFLALCFCLSVSVALCFFESNKVITAWNVFNVMYGENPELFTLSRRNFRLSHIVHNNRCIKGLNLVVAILFSQ